MIESRGEKLFKIINAGLLAVFSMLSLYPFLYVVSASVSLPHNVVTGKVLLWPKGFTFDSYKEVLGNSDIWMAYSNTIFYTVVGTAISMCFTICGAYALSKKRLRGRTWITIFVTLTLWFDAGMIPFYLLLRDLDLLNSRMGIVIAFACNAFNVILLRTSFEALPDELEESVKVDGGNDLQVLLKVYLPLIKPGLATVGLFYAIERWNGYFWSMIMLTDMDKIPLQVLLKKMIVENDIQSEYAAALNFSSTLSAETVTYATIVVSILPVVIVYPYIQKYFIKGMLVGAVKG
ncbi:carbohydrate ABC transporter membrane protein 2 (CUT1 family) [Paenibacillus cellulosilyticus]|uniref:Carbohydrate ABC transporter membrane protein 2 (CUT1 family) n=1 Tax=Paenibacillus cellulosilyticus TaxID=375489 RepID=A0A2V2YV94_9BACL|nr:carbohydrate ABC transporter permease [Paenibacillus cellulosilyticus]PWW02390.1 carbohydrate ABC transporter membrane protein 2 (CUT1 family) [Paenibacillus cellulosilyticus]QKS47103.1 carbohydrate ABC transporter permease [Paenibacillus cellulosilyticus]